MIVSDNGTQFDSEQFREFCNELGIKKSFSSVSHPQTNGQVEAINKIIKHTLKTKLEEHRAIWADELPQVLWSYRTTTRTSTGETPFSMTYGVEAMIPVKVGVPMHRREFYNQDTNHELMCGELDLLEETRAQALLRVIEYQQRSARYFNSKVKERRFKVGDLVLRKVIQNTKEINAGVISPN